MVRISLVPWGIFLSGKKTDQKNPVHEPWSVCVNLLTSFLNISRNDDDDDDDYHNSVPERYRSVFFLHNRVYMPKKLFYCFWRSIS